MSGYECADCGFVMSVDIPRCLPCQWKKKKQGICSWCGEKPVKSKQSKYCADCQAEAIKKRNSREFSEAVRAQFRDSSMRENTHETKHLSGR